MRQAHSFDTAARLDATRAFISYGPVTHNSQPGNDGESGGIVPAAFLQAQK
jgi:hypothetical protein